MNEVDLTALLAESAYEKLGQLSAQMGGANKGYILNLIIENTELYKQAHLKVKPIVYVEGPTGKPISVGMDFLDTIRSMVEAKFVRLDNCKPGRIWGYVEDDTVPVIGWIDDYVNLYPTETFKHAREFYRTGSQDAIYHELRASGSLAMTGENGRTAKKRVGPDGKQHRVLVLKPEVLNIKAGGMR